jgi:hypothetical protein
MGRCTHCAETQQLCGSDAWGFNAIRGLTDVGLGCRAIEGAEGVLIPDILYGHLAGSGICLQTKEAMPSSCRSLRDREN